ncbi:hypothetical protein H4219_001468 [Mycoemilia scoparia]|uniref:Oligopeptide transporter n=1 Tax=Mycoemilia scoparia TaxID=417184 RepID=A0A9W8A059_9FUNG|nr:hypothetical protein H4219_001468 [Mycoemilia scoparia]
MNQNTNNKKDADTCSTSRDLKVFRSTKKTFSNNDIATRVSRRSQRRSSAKPRTNIRPVCVKKTGKKAKLLNILKRHPYTSSNDGTLYSNGIGRSSVDLDKQDVAQIDIGLTSIEKIDDNEPGLACSMESTASTGCLDYDSPYEIVRTHVKNKDDPTLPSFTIRAVLAGLILNMLLSFVNTFFWYRKNPISITGFIAQFTTYLLGMIMAHALPNYSFKMFGKYSLCLNPGPFSIKEHVIATVVATSGSTAPYAIDIITVKRLFFKSPLGFGPSVLLMLSSQTIGYSFAGLVRGILVYPAAMIWPEILVNTSLFLGFHEKNPLLDFTIMGKFKMTKNMLFWITFALSSVWHWVPGYLFTTASMFPLICMIAPNNVIAHQLGDGLRGLGIMSFSLDWSMISNNYTGNPISSPLWISFNVIFGFVAIAWIIIPAGYYYNLWNSGILPIYSSSLFNSTGGSYDIDILMTPKQRLNSTAYNNYGPPAMSFSYAVSYGAGFLTLTSLFMHVSLYHGSEIWGRIKELRNHTVAEDVHARLMTVYKEVPLWWYLCLFVAMFIQGLILGELYDMLPWWTFALSLAIALLFITPVGILQAISNVQPDLSSLAKLICGYILPGNPIANVTFNTFGYITVVQALSLVSNQKLGHYMKIPPRNMLTAQLIGTISAVFIQLGVAFWIMDTVDNICVDQAGNDWSCIQAETFTESIVWGLVGPKRIFGNSLSSPYYVLYWMFPIGLVAPIPFWYLGKKFPASSLWKNINIPVIFSVISGFIPAPTQDFPMWFIWCIVFNYFIYKYKKSWWEKYAVTFTAAMDVGVAFSTIFIFLCTKKSKIAWWGNDYHCSLSTLPFINPQSSSSQQQQ